MSVLKEKQFEILPNDEASDGFVFGIGAEVSVNDAGFDPGESNWMTQDAENARRGVLGFGRDVPGAKTWLWESHVDRETAEEAVDTLDRFSASWHPDGMRNPGDLTAIRYRLAGRDRRVFGRPRAFAAPPANQIDSGYVDVTHEFQCVDAFTYDDTESMATIPFSSGAEGGGFVLPAHMPLITDSPVGTGSDQLVVGGSARAYPIIRFNGPWLNPTIQTDHWTLTWNGQIPASGWVEIDCRPWRLTVLNQSGASVVGGLPRRTWLEDIWFAPQSRPQVTLAGSGASGNAGATVRWRNTWTSI